MPFPIHYLDDRLFSHLQASGLFAPPPNTMNRYGLVLNEIGLRGSLRALLSLYQPLAQLAFPRQGGVRLLDHHSFIVSYKVTIN